MKKFKELFCRLVKNNLLIVKNTGYLTIVEVLKLLMPFIALPYIISIVGGEKYGEIVFTQSIIIIIAMIINWGLDISASKDTAENSKNLVKKREIYTSVIAIKSILLFLSFAFILIATNCIPFFEERKTLLLFAFINCFSEVLYPIWFYQGIQKMQYMAIVKTISVFVYVFMIFVALRDESQYEYVVLFQSLGNLFGGIVSVILIFYKEKIRIVHVPFKRIWRDFVDSYPFFLSRISMIINSNAPKLLLGIIDQSKLAVSAYDLALKFTSAMLVPIQMLNTAVYPHIASTKSLSFVRKFFRLNILFSFGMALILFICAPILDTIFAQNMIPEVTTITRMMSIYVLLGGITTYIGTPVLVSFGYSKYFNRSVIFSSVILLALFAAIYLLNSISLYSVIILLILTELFILSYRYYYCKKYSLI